MTVWPYIRFEPEPLVDSLHRATVLLRKLSADPANTALVSEVRNTFNPDTFPILQWVSRRAVLCPSMKTSRRLREALTELNQAIRDYDDIADDLAISSAITRFPHVCESAKWFCDTLDSGTCLFAKAIDEDHSLIPLTLSQTNSWQDDLRQILVRHADTGEVVDTGRALRAAFEIIGKPARSILIVDRYFFSLLKPHFEKAGSKLLKGADASAILEFFRALSDWQIASVDIVTTLPAGWPDSSPHFSVMRLKELLESCGRYWSSQLGARQPIRVQVRVASRYDEVVHDRLIVFGATGDSIRDQFANKGANNSEYLLTQNPFHSALLSQSVRAFAEKGRKGLVGIQAASVRHVAGYLKRMEWAFSRDVKEYKQWKDAYNTDKWALGFETDLFG
jgi:hypothetical protein